MPIPLKNCVLRALLSAVGAFLPGVVVGGIEGDCHAQVLGVLSKRINSRADVTFDLLTTGSFQTSYTATRLRTFRGASGVFTQVREQLRMQGDGSQDSAFNLTFVDLPGASQDPVAAAHWTEVYRTSAGLLHQLGGFRVRDPIAAAANYQIYDFGLAQRAGREARRVVVYPVRPDKGIWVLDLDTLTGATLYSAEYDSGLRLINEIESVSFTPTSGLAKSLQPGSVVTKPAWSWTPRMEVLQFPTFGAAATKMGDPGVIQPAIQALVSEYTLSTNQVTEDPVNGDRTLVLGYTDGIDEFFVLQSRTDTDPFVSGLAKRADGGSHMIASYDDPGLRAYVFYENGLLFQVFGRSSLARLKDVSLRLCQQAVTGH